MAFKMLFAAEEVNILIQDPAAMKQLQQLTKTSGVISEQYFPGSHLHQLTIQGPTAEAVFIAVVSILGKIGDALGSVSSGDVGVEHGGGRIKAVLPKRASAGLIGPG